MDWRDIKEFLKDSLGYILFFIATLVVVIYIVSIGQIIGPSMEPNYHEGNIILVDKLRYRLVKIQRFDVITFRHNERFYTKRVIGIPGEIIKYNDNQLYINNKLVKEPFKREGITQDFITSKIPEDTYYVIGDHRTNSEDSRYFGPIDKLGITGKVEMIIWR